MMVVVWVHRANLWTDQANYLPLYVRTDTHVDVLIAGSLLGLLTLWGVLRVGEGRWLRLHAGRDRGAGGGELLLRDR